MSQKYPCRHAAWRTPNAAGELEVQDLRGRDRSADKVGPGLFHSREVAGEPRRGGGSGWEVRGTDRFGSETCISHASRLFFAGTAPTLRERGSTQFGGYRCWWLCFSAEDVGSLGSRVVKLETNTPVNNRGSPKASPFVDNLSESIM